MKNLVLVGEKRHSLQLPTGGADGDRHVVDMCQVFDELGDSCAAWVVLTNDGIVARISSSDSVEWMVTLNDVQPGDGWFSINYADPEMVCLSSRGAIVSVSPTTGEAELVGVFDHGLEAGTWSPDGEVLLLVTAVTDEDDSNQINSVVLTMNSQFEVLSEVTIDSYVPARQGENCGVSAVWRPDGSLCAVSSVDASDNTRKVRIYKRDTLELHAVGRSEDASGTIVKNLGAGCLAWASAGCSQLLSSVQRKGKKTLQVVFFESNGLRHREFVLDEAATTVVQALAWNVDSDLLAVTLREDNGTNKVQLWHRSNYHWYLKQEFRYPGQVVQRAVFDQETSSKLYVLLRDFCWREYEVRWNPSSTQINSGCSAYAVDGCTLNATLLDKAMVPPPMYMSSVKTDMPINHLAFCSDRSSTVCAVLGLSNGNLVLLQNFQGKPQFTKTIPVEWASTKDVSPTSLRSFVVVGAGDLSVQLIAVACTSKQGELEKLVEMSVSIREERAACTVTSTMDIAGAPLLKMVNWSDSGNGALIELQDGTLLEYEHGEFGGSLLPCQAEPLLEPCPWIAGVRDVEKFNIYEESRHHSGRLVVGLSTRGRLYCSDFLLADSASSFCLSMEHQFLCYATSGSRCQLRFLPLVDVYNFDPLMGSDQNEYLEGYEPRDMERGTRLVAVLPSKPLAVLQMPRGNLEGVYPRALVLRYVMTRIDAGEYGEAFLEMRRQKVDLNLLVDMNPSKFIREGIQCFIEQVVNIDHLNLFISCLQDFDVTKFRFPVPKWLRSSQIQKEDLDEFDFSSKVNMVCREARKIMIQAEREGRTVGGREISEGHFLLPILSTFAKENPPQLKEALSLIKENTFRNQVASSKKPPLFSEKAQASIHYLAFLAEYELLFETALGMYDYDVARAVARNSQMDPKTYLPLLKRLRSLPLYYARYEVDLRLMRYDLALENLVNSCSEQELLETDVGVQETTDATTTSTLGNSFDRCMALIEERNLYRLGLKLFCSEPAMHRRIMIAFGEHLLHAMSPKTALSVFCAAKPPDLEGAKRAARACGEWRYFFAMLERNTLEDSTPEGVDPDECRHLARSVADEISASANSSSTYEERRSKYSDGARILLDYGNDLDGAVDLLLGGEMWGESFRIACLHSRPDLGKRSVEGAVMYAQNTISEMAERTTRFEDANSRYAEVLKIRKQAASGLEGLEPDDTGSLYSSASNASNMSLRSNTSTSSTGSSVSSVISVKSNTTFSMTGGDEMNRHRSKFNKGRRQKKPKKQKKKTNKIRRGSEEELQSLVTIMKAACVDMGLSQTISETCQFLLVWDHGNLARDLFDSYNTMCDSINKSQQERIETTRDERISAERQSRKEGENFDDNYLLVELPVEQVVDALSCPSLEDSLIDVFSLP